MANTGGWHGKLLRIDLSSGEKQLVPTLDLAKRFIGGRGVLSKIYWDEIDPTTDAMHPANPLIFMTGPLAGTPAIAGSRWVIGGKSSFLYPDQYGIANLGGRFGVKMKATGIDGLVITGTASKPSYLHIDDKKVSVLDASGLWGLRTTDTLKRLESAHGKKSESICIGPAGEKLVRFAIIMGNSGASGSSGFAAVMGSKNLKAVVIEGSMRAPVARPNVLKKINKDIRSLTEEKIPIEPVIDGIEHVKHVHCPGCQVGCSRGIYKHVPSGAEAFLKNCQSSYMYYNWDQAYHGGSSSDNLFLTTALCNELGLCTQEISNLIRWLNDCYQNGVLGDDIGLPLSKIGSMDFFTTLVGKISSREGFGDTLAEGTVRASITLGDDAVQLANSHTTRTGFHSNVYSARFFIAHAVLFATESTHNIARLHEIAFSIMRWTMWLASEGTLSTVDTDVIREMAKRFWGDEQAADFSTYQGKALAAKLIQDRGFAKENLVACDFLYPLMLGHRQNDIVGDPTLESRMLSSVTGIDFSEDAYNETGERCFNLQRAIHAVEGYRIGRTDDVLTETEFESPLDLEDGYFSIFNPESLLPGPDGEIVSRRGKVIEHDKFEAMMDEYYKLRHWDAKSGLQKEETLRKLDLSDIISDLKKKKLVV
ncbi:MAG: hypothetical protein GY762_06765 [Proteobacteria bacterium]|nr:hypothetical protein [Pseudomonadota bacterium]